MQVTDKYEWVGRGEDGFPQMGGKVTQVPGKNLTIRCFLIFQVFPLTLVDVRSRSVQLWSRLKQKASRQHAPCMLPLSLNRSRGPHTARS